MHSPATIDLPVPAPAIAKAMLPATYEAARTAIAECDRIDECKTWADKAAALASYARQAKDDSLSVMARRIQARALRRGGQLLKQIKPANGARTDLGTVSTRSSEAETAGLSERQRKTALQVASVPEEKFNRQVESGQPPTVTQLAAQGKAKRAPREASKSAPVVEEIPEACAALIAFVKCSLRYEPASFAQTFDSDDAVALRGWVTAADRWLKTFAENLTA